MNINGVQVFGRAYNATSTAAQPARVDIKIGKGLKSKEVTAYLTTGKNASINIDRIVQSTIEYGTLVYYNETTGVLTLDGGTVITAAYTTKYVGVYGDNSWASSGYFVFNASKSPSLVSIPNLQQRVAYLSDVKSSGTAGGSSVTGYQTRTLNTLSDPTGIVSSLASNQFSLPAGVYEIVASSPARQSDTHRIRLRNITDSVTSLLGSSELAGSAIVSQTNSILTGQITLTSTKTFEIQHQINTAKATDGLGAAGTSGESEVYTQVKITKIK